MRLTQHYGPESSPATYIHTSIHTYIHTYIRMRLTQHYGPESSPATYIHTSIRMRLTQHYGPESSPATYIHTSIHTYIHTYIRMRLTQHYGPESSPAYKAAQRNFIESMAGYAVVCYLLQVMNFMCLCACMCMYVVCYLLQVRTEHVLYVHFAERGLRVYAHVCLWFCVFVFTHSYERFKKRCFQPWSNSHLFVRLCVDDHL